jgi:HAD superfamily hydrolase (TIGR01484 family)
MKPLPWNQAPLESLRRIRGVALDIDDTLSSDGKLTAEAYEALWKLSEAGFAVVPVTGRPAGWCDHIARFWPVDAVVGENGAFVFFREGAQGVRKRLDTPGAEANPSRRRERLAALEATLRGRFPALQVASDQAYREHDLAIDICEDVAPWAREEIDALLKLAAEEGAHAKLSSIHVNAWFGDYDKASGMKHWLSKGGPGLRATVKGGLPAWEEWLFIGDSPNDEPLFQVFEATVGVANLAKSLDRLRFPPRWLTEARSGAGFVQMAERLIAAHRP